jgi:hypothetical protein
MADTIITYVVAYVIIWIHSDGWRELVPAVAVTWLVIAILQLTAGSS